MSGELDTVYLPPELQGFNNYPTIVSDLRKMQESYHLNLPLATDAQYDELFAYLLKVERDNPHMVAPCSPSQRKYEPGMPYWVPPEAEGDPVAKDVPLRVRQPWEDIRPGAVINISGMAFRVHKITKKNVVLRPLGLVRK